MELFKSQKHWIPGCLPNLDTQLWSLFTHQKKIKNQLRVFGDEAYESQALE